MAIEERVEESKNWFERAAQHVPGYRGYKEKELRREADKIQRLYVAERLEEARKALEKVQLDLTNRGSLELLSIIDATSRRLRTSRDRVQFADYGYAGMFDAVKVGQQKLDELYQFDVQLQERSRSVEELATELSADSPSLRADLDLLDERIEALDAYFAGREHLITGAGR
jgi:small-conductance mechanosensitive channel